MFIRFDKGAKFSSVRRQYDAEISESLDGFDDAGYILRDTDVVIDIDHLDKSVIEKMIDIFEINTQIVWTDRGAHLYFKKPVGFRRSRGVVPLSFKVEYKTSSNTRATTIKRNGVKRKVENEGIREPLPDYLIADKQYCDLTGLAEGDGRNNELYKLKNKIARLQDSAKILRFVNNYIFETPLSDKELQTVTRHEDSKAMVTGKDDEYYAATIIMEQINPIVYNNHIFFYQRDHYIHDDNILRRIISDTFPGFKTRYTDEVIKQIEYRAPLTPKNHVFAIKLKNGYLLNGKFYEGDYTDFTPYYIDLKYDPNTKPIQLVDDYLDNLSEGDKAYKDYITEIFGLCLVTDEKVIREVSKFFFFIGKGGEGKGTFLDIVGKILGEENCSRIDIDDLGNETYLSTLDCKLANLGDDQQNRPINSKQMKRLKNISTGDTLVLRNLYENPRIAKSTATMIFTTNYKLMSFEKDESYRRRVVWCPMFKKPKKKSITFFEDVTTPECLQYWIKLAVEGYMRIYDRGRDMPMPPIVQKYTDRYHEENDNMKLYIASVDEEAIDGKRSPQLYEEYEAWAEENGVKTLSKKHMVEIVEELRGYTLKVKRVDKGTPARVFVKTKELDDEYE